MGATCVPNSKVGPSNHIPHWVVVDDIPIGVDLLSNFFVIATLFGSFLSLE